MVRNRRLLRILLAGLMLAAFSLSASEPPKRSASSAQGTVAGTPPARTPTGSVPIGVPHPTAPGTRGTTSTNRREPCWEVAGVSKAAMQQRRVIAQQTKQEVEAVCANGSLTPAQKQERIRQIHQQERQQLQGLISPQQQEAMRACRQQRGGGVSLGGGHIGGHGSGPCGSLPGLVNRSNASDFDEDPPEK